MITCSGNKVKEKLQTMINSGKFLLHGHIEGEARIMKLISGISLSSSRHLSLEMQHEGLNVHYASALSR